MSVPMSKDERITALETKVAEMSKYTFELDDRIHTILHKMAVQTEVMEQVVSRLNDNDAKFEVIEEMLGEIDA